MTGPSLDLDALREKAEKATPGPWEHVSGRDFAGEPFRADNLRKTYELMEEQQ